MFGLSWIAVKVGSFMLIYGWIFSKLVRPAEAAWVKRRLLPTAVILFASGLVLPSVWFYWAIIFALIPLMSRSTAEAACMYVLAILVTPPASREIGVAGMYILPFDKWLFGGLGLVLSALIYRSKQPLRRGWVDWPFILIISLELIQARGSNFTSFLRQELAVSLSLILPYVIISRSLRYPEQIRRLVFAIVFVGFFLGMEAIYEARTNFLPYDSIGQHLSVSGGISGYSKQRGGALRASTSFGESTSFAIFLATAFLAAIASRPSFRTRNRWLIALFGILAGLYAANARAAVIVAALGLLLTDFYRKRYASLAAKLAVLGIFAIGAVGLAGVSPKFAERLGVSGSASDSALYRDVLLKRGIEQIRQHPLLGVSVRDTFVELADLRQGEGIVDFVNAYVYYGMIAGVGGILAMLACFFGMPMTMLSVRRKLRRQPGMLPVGAFVFAVCLSTSVAAFLTTFGAKSSIIFYNVLGIGAALNTRRSRRQSAEAEAEEEARIGTDFAGAEFAGADTPPTGAVRA